MRRINLIVVAIALLIGVCAYYLGARPEVMTQFYTGLTERCDAESHLCLALVAPFQSLADTEYIHHRSRISKSKLPLVRIYVSDGALRKLHNRRNSILAENRGILLATDEDWVKATLIADDGKEQKKVKARLRLKGDWADHINTDKLSFRIKVRDKDLIIGMSKFSIQSPHTRKNQSEPMLLNMMRQVGILAPRYLFVDVRLNDQAIGIMALEEHFTKEMIESQARREGPIVAMSEDWIWEQRFLNFNRSSLDYDTFPEKSRFGVHYQLNDYPIKMFRSEPLKPGSLRTQHAIRAISRLRDAVDGVSTGVAAFDLDLLARWWVLINIWNAEHGAFDHNRRFYFNPVTGALEPIAFDNHAEPQNFNERISDFAVRSVLKTPEFREAVVKAVGLITDLLTSDDYKTEFNRSQDAFLKILEIDGIQPKPVMFEDLQVNLATFIDDNLDYLNFRNVRGQSQGVKPETVSDDPIETNTALTLLDTPLHTHLRAFWFWHAEGEIALQLKNLTIDPITVESVYFKGRPEEGLLPGARAISAYQKGRRQHIIEHRFNDSGFDLTDEMLVRYRSRDIAFIKPVILQFRNYDEGYLSGDAARARLYELGILANEKMRSLTFPAGHYVITNSIEIGKGWRLVLHAGADIELRQGAVLKVQGPVYALGQADSPVRISIQSSRSRGLLGSWGGLLVQQSGGMSRLRHIEILGNTASGPSGRQGSRGLTGCLTFFQSDVRIRDARFKALQCEDALNIVSSKFDLQRVTIDGAHADAFDSDFSAGVIKDSQFKRSGNDAVDISGSHVEVIDTTFTTTGDKAISVGEESTLVAEGIRVDGALSGIVSKDGSVATIRDSRFANVDGSSLFAYVKKPEFGVSQISCRNCEFENVESVATEQFGCRITVDNREIDTKPFSRKQLRAAGYIE